MSKTSSAKGGLLLHVCVLQVILDRAVCISLCIFAAGICIVIPRPLCASPFDTVFRSLGAPAAVLLLALSFLSPALSILLPATSILLPILSVFLPIFSVFRSLGTPVPVLLPAFSVPLAQLASTP